VLRLDGVNARLYYNDVLIGTSASVDATLTSTKHGLRSSNVANTLDNFTCYATGAGGEYSTLAVYADMATEGTTLAASPQAMTITNDGDATCVNAIITVTAGSAAITALTLATDDAELSYSGTIAIGKELVIDCGALSVKNDGAAAYAGFTWTGNHTSRWWLPLYSGDNTLTVTWTGGSTDSEIKVEFYDAWH